MYADVTDMAVQLGSATGARSLKLGLQSLNFSNGRILSTAESLRTRLGSLKPRKLVVRAEEKTVVDLREVTGAKRGVPSSCKCVPILALWEFENALFEFVHCHISFKSCKVGRDIITWRMHFRLIICAGVCWFQRRGERRTTMKSANGDGQVGRLRRPGKLPFNWKRD